MFIAVKSKEHRAPIGAPYAWLLCCDKHIAPPEHEHSYFGVANYAALSEPGFWLGSMKTAAAPGLIRNSFE